MVLGDAVGLTCSRDHSCDCRVCHAELQGCRLQADVMPNGDLPETIDLCDDLWRCFLVLERRSTCEDSRAVRTSDNDFCAALQGKGHQPLERVRVIQQCVAAGKQESVRLELFKVEQQLARLGLVDAQ